MFSILVGIELFIIIINTYFLCNNKSKSAAYLSYIGINLWNITLLIELVIFTGNTVVEDYKFMRYYYIIASVLVLLIHNSIILYSKKQYKIK